VAEGSHTDDGRLHVDLVDAGRLPPLPAAFLAGDDRDLLAPLTFLAPGDDPAPALADLPGDRVVLKGVAAGLVHKSEAGGVALNLHDVGDVETAVDSMRGLAERFLVERMAPKPLAELLIGAAHDPVSGPALTIAAGGVLAELLDEAGLAVENWLGGWDGRPCRPDAPEIIPIGRLK